jgi:uncharacterized protein (TIGR04255 family)
VGAPRALARPPITEALIDLRIASDPAIDATRLSALHDLLKPDYPSVNERREVRAQLTVEQGGKLLPSSEDLGFGGLFFKSADGRRIAQFRRDGFTLNQLPPYENADQLITEAMRLWQFYREAVNPIAITRVAFRYINSLRLPYQPGDDLDRFLAASPDLPKAWPQSVAAFLTRVMMNEGDDVVVVTQSLEPNGQEPRPVTLDIDVMAHRDFEPDGKELAVVLQRLREVKNRVFFASLTDEALELYV